MEVGRKLYYEKTTGNVILDTGERQGSVIETTVQQDFEMYLALQSYVPDQVGVIQLEYGQYRDQFLSCFGYHINTETEEIIFNFIPPEASSDEAKTTKIAELNKVCNTEILAGFEYVKDSTTYLLGFDEQDQANLTQQMAILSVSPEPITWKAKGKLVFLQFTRDEFLQLGLVAKQHKESKMQKYYQLCGQVYACTTLEEVEAIVW